MSCGHSPPFSPVSGCRQQAYIWPARQGRIPIGLYYLVCTPFRIVSASNGGPHTVAGCPWLMTVVTSLWLVKMNMNKREKLKSMIDNFIKWYKKEYIVVRIRFNTTSNGLLGPITLYIDPRNKEIVGSDLRF